MASSRLYKIGSIFSRVDGLIRSGAIKYEDRPLWYDIYAAFPPKYEPGFDQPVSNAVIKPVLYKEDIVRAQLHKNHLAKKLWNLNEEATSWPIINKCLEEMERGESVETACAYVLSQETNSEVQNAEEESISNKLIEEMEESQTTKDN